MKRTKVLLILLICLIVLIAIGLTGCDCYEDWDGYGIIVKKYDHPGSSFWTGHYYLHNSPYYEFTVEYTVVNADGTTMTKTATRQVYDERVYREFKEGDKVFYNKKTLEWSHAE